MDTTPSEEEVGGINLNPTLLNLQIKRDDSGLPLPIENQPINTMQIDGFFPIIIYITPVTNLPFLLGVSEEDNSDKLFSKIAEAHNIINNKKKRNALLGSTRPVL